MRLRTNSAIRQALHGLYVALFQAKKACPNDFPFGRLTTIQTAIMGIENFGWRVVGITPEALDLLATQDFRKDKLPGQLCRGHVVERIRTTRLLFGREEPFSVEEFFELFLKNDETVIMLKGQNKIDPAFPTFIPIDNPDGELFPNGPLIAWKHRRKEREFLRQLHETRNAA